MAQSKMNFKNIAMIGVLAYKFGSLIAHRKQKSHWITMAFFLQLTKN